MENKEIVGGEIEVKDTKAKRTRGRRNMPFASISASDCLIIAEGIWKYASGQKIRRITLFDQIGKSPDSGPSRTMVTASSKYGFTQGGYQAEYLELTPDGFIAFNPEESEANKLKAKFKLIIEGNEYFNQIYENYKNMKLPIKTVIIDFLKEKGLEDEYREIGAELFISNAKYLGLIKVLAGAERLISIEQAIEELNDNNEEDYEEDYEDKVGDSASTYVNEEKIISDNKSTKDWSKICFYITPIGNDKSEERKHSDLFLESIVVPALQEFGFSVIRADQISSPGMITSQIIDYIYNAELVITDLSFHNPNVFYELSLRHTTKKPTVHIIRKCDTIPFDINDFRTIIIDDSSIYTLIPSLDTYRNEITQQVRQLLENPDSIDNPVLSYLERRKK